MMRYIHIYIYTDTSFFHFSTNIHQFREQKNVQFIQLYNETSHLKSFVIVDAVIQVNQEQCPICIISKSPANALFNPVF